MKIEMLDEDWKEWGVILSEIVRTLSVLRDEAKQRDIKGTLNEHVLDLTVFKTKYFTQINTMQGDNNALGSQETGRD